MNQTESENSISFLQNGSHHHFSIVMSCLTSEVEFQKTLDFLLRTGMPEPLSRNITIMRCACCEQPVIPYGNPDDYNNKPVEDVGGSSDYSEAQHVLFLKAGILISWGSIDTLFRATLERPDAYAIGAVYRNGTGRFKFPKQSRKVSVAIKMFFQGLIDGYPFTVSVENLFPQAILFKIEAFEALAESMANQRLNYNKKDWLNRVRNLGEIVCVPAAQFFVSSKGA